MLCFCGGGGLFVLPWMFLCCYGGGGLFDFFDFLWLSCGKGGGDGFFSGGSGGFLVTEVVVMGG